MAQCIKKGDLYAFDQALKEGEDEFVNRRIYLPLERTHDICLRNLLRKVFTTGGFEDPKHDAPDAPPVRRTRVTVPEFTAAINISSKQQVDTDEVECQLANMIYKVSAVTTEDLLLPPPVVVYTDESDTNPFARKGLMKGYIARERQIVVLSKKNDAFPGTGV